MSVRQWHIIGVGSGWGAKDMGTADGPKVLMGAMSPSFRKYSRTATYWHEEGPLCPANPVPLPLLQAQTHADRILKMSTSLCTETKTTVLRGDLPLVLGGDHSIAIGTWSGVKAALDNEDMGLIWVDAHMDAHSPQTSPSLNMHGMPVAVLLGYGEARFTALGGVPPKLKPENLCLIGVRCFEKEEATFLARLGVRVYEIEEVQQRGFTTVFREARTKIPARRFGLSIDVDAFDPQEAPGTGTPEVSGLWLADVKDALYGLAQDPHFLGLEIAEVNPHRDSNHKTCRLAWELAATVTGDGMNGLFG